MGFSSVKDVNMVQSVLKSFFNYLNSIIVIIDYFGGKIHRVYALTQPERELLSNRYSNHATHVRSDNECSIIPL